MIKIDTGDTAWILISTALVFLMTPGLALFYGGLVRKKNILSTTMHSYVAILIVSIQWIVIGYSLSFGPDIKGIIGNLSWLGLNGVGVDPNPDYAATIPGYLFMAFQMMFAIITTALISGAIAERMKFSAYILFITLWSFFAYNLAAHWVWGVGGWIRTLGALDFAGGTVVHILSGVSALVAAIMLGKRSKRGNEQFVPHNIPMVVLGAGLLWFGWFGFNAGSALGANGLAALAFINTNTAAAVAALAWLAVEWFHNGKPTTVGAASGAVAGLVAITPAAGFVTPMASILIGLIGGLICYFSVAVAKAKLGYDDALDAFGVHGVGGTWGAIATGLFATKAVNAAGADGLFYGGNLLGKQFVAIGATYVLAIVSTFVILKVVSFFVPLRATQEEEDYGLDGSLHGEDAYRDYAFGGELLFSGDAHATMNNMAKAKVSVN